MPIAAIHRGLGGLKGPLGVVLRQPLFWVVSLDSVDEKATT
jgi:hypothetical protein